MEAQSSRCIRCRYRANEKLRTMCRSRQSAALEGVVFRHHVPEYLRLPTCFEASIQTQESHGKNDLYLDWAISMDVQLLH
jgi:hypothetical protein